MLVWQSHINRSMSLSCTLVAARFGGAQLLVFGGAKTMPLDKHDAKRYNSKVERKAGRKRGGGWQGSKLQVSRRESTRTSKTLDKHDTKRYNGEVESKHRQGQARRVQSGRGTC